MTTEKVNATAPKKKPDYEENKQINKSTQKLNMTKEKVVNKTAPKCKQDRAAEIKN